MTMIRQFPPQQHSPAHLFGHEAPCGPYNSLPASPRITTCQGPLEHGSGAASLRQSSQFPQQYARPLQRTNTYPSQGSPKHESRKLLGQPENMLRRKTPNGILAAAYDGTSVEPQAMKHILLPATPTEQKSANAPGLAYGMRQTLPLRTPANSLGASSMPLQEQPHLRDNSWNPMAYFGIDAGKVAMTRSTHQLPQIDSMLNQMPMQNLQGQYLYAGHQPLAFMPLSLQSPLGPTALNEPGPYGPYWPNGTFVPYRPAALRDPRFHPHHPANWPSQDHHGNAGYSVSGFQLLQNANSGIPGHVGQFGQIQSLEALPESADHRIHSQAHGSALRQTHYDGTAHPLPNDYSTEGRHGGHKLRPDGKVELVFPQATQDFQLPIDSSGQSTPRGDATPVSTSLAEFGPQSSNAHYREKIFTWAHAVYVDLLKFLHQTRRNEAQARQNSNHRHPPRPSFYPKPPRQSSIDPSSAYSGRRHSENGGQQARSTVPYTNTGHTSSIFTTHDQSSQSARPSHTRAISLLSHPHGQLKEPDDQRRSSWHQHPPSSVPLQRSDQSMEDLRTPRKVSGTSLSSMTFPLRHEIPPTSVASSALDTLTTLCEESSWQWIEGMLLGGSLAYALGDYQKALRWYSKILASDPNHVEAISNLAATLLAVGRRQDAEQYWLRAVRLRPSFFEAVEHLVGLLCGDHRGKEAVSVIDHVERSLRYHTSDHHRKSSEHQSECSLSTGRSPSLSESSDRPTFDYDGESETIFKDSSDLPGANQPGFGSSGYAIPGSDNGRILQLVHAKGNMLYALGDNVAAAKAFETAVLIGVGRGMQGVGGLIKHILAVFTGNSAEVSTDGSKAAPSSDPILLPPDKALFTARLCFPSHGELPGLRYIPGEGMAKKAAISTTSNSLLSLAKIFQDGMATNSPKATAYQTTYGVREILALYYLSLSLQPSPSTANNVGILLAGVQQSVPSKHATAANKQAPLIPGVDPGSGIALALAYYNYGLNLDSRHAHLFTNLGSLLKDIGQLSAAIKMYEQAVACDANFDIALANLANAVKDQGRIADAITYYKRAVHASPDFAEAVCGLANALNSVCGWHGRGGIAADGGKRDRWHVDDKGMLLDAKLPGAASSGWIKRVVDLVEKQLADGEDWGRGIMDSKFSHSMLRALHAICTDKKELKEREDDLRTTLSSWAGQKWEGAKLVRIAERATRRLGWQWYQDEYVNRTPRPDTIYSRPQIPATLTVPAAPTVLPFHTFTSPMSAKQIRLISQRNGLRISCSTLRAPWLPSIVCKPPAPPNPYLKVGYVSSDFNNHPLAHLMQSVFGMHDPARVKAFCYATTASDNSVHRQQIEREAPVFYDASTWPAERLVNQIVEDGIHILVNLNGYTRGARNEVFAARPAPIQMSFMGFAGTLGAEWCDYLLADETAVPPETLRPWRRNVDLEDQMVDESVGGDQDEWVYGENIIYCRDTFFCCDHRQSAPDAQGKQLDWEEEQTRRWNMRKEIFPNLPDDVVILGNFNQLYKIDPTTFRTWLRILARLPKAVLWLLRFPDLGETHLRQTAVAWAGPEVAARLLFTDVAPKASHIARARVCDLFLDTAECNAHTTAADVLWSGTPLLTLPRHAHKMCSRMAASILRGALPRGPRGERAAGELVAAGEEEYEEQAVRLARGCVYEAHRPGGRLGELRRMLYEERWSSALFDTRRWVRDLEEAYGLAWGRWVRGEGGDIWLEKKGDGG